MLPLRVRYGVSFVVQTLIYSLCQSLQQYMQHYTISDRFIMAPDCTIIFTQVENVVCKMVAIMYWPQCVNAGLAKENSVNILSALQIMWHSYLYLNSWVHSSMPICWNCEWVVFNLYCNVCFVIETIPGYRLYPAKRALLAMLTHGR